MNRQERSQCLAAAVVCAIVFVLVAALAFSCAGPVDSAPGQATWMLQTPSSTAEYYDYLPYISKSVRPTVTPMATARPTAAAAPAENCRGKCPIVKEAK